MRNNCLFVLKRIVALVLISFSLGLSGCANINPSLYSVNMRYDSAQAVIPEYLKADEKTRNDLITVAEFTDTRQVDDKKIIGRVRERDDTRVPIFPKDVMPTQAVADGIKSIFAKSRL